MHDRPWLRAGNTGGQFPHTASKAPTACSAPSSLSIDHLPSELRRLGPSSKYVTAHTPALVQHGAASHLHCTTRHPPMSHPAPPPAPLAGSQQQAAAANLGNRPRLRPRQSTAPPRAVNRVRAIPTRSPEASRPLPRLAPPAIPDRAVPQSVPAASARVPERVAVLPRLRHQALECPALADLPPTV